MQLHRIIDTKSRTPFKRRTLGGPFISACLFCALLFASCNVMASGYSPMPLYQVTIRTDLWAHVEVLAMEEADTGVCRLSLAVQESTDPDLPDTIQVKTRWACDKVDIVGRELFLALHHRDEEYRYLEEHGWNSVIDEDTVILDTMVGAQAVVGKALAWALMRDMRLLVDQDGVVPDTIRQFWLEKLYNNGDVAETHLALDFLEQLREPGIDTVALARNVAKHFKQRSIAARDDGRMWRLQSWTTDYRVLFGVAASTITRAGNVEAAEILKRLYWEEQRNEALPKYAFHDRAIAQLLLTPPTEANARKLGSMLGVSIKADHSTLMALARIPGKAVDDLLWRITENTQAYGIENAWAWGALAYRQDPRLRAYLKANVLEPDLPTLEYRSARDLENIRREAWKWYLAIPPTEEERIEDVQILAGVVAAGDPELDLVWELGRLLRPSDRGLSEILAKVRIEHLGRRRLFCQELIQRFPHPAYIPLVTSWAIDETHRQHIQTLVELGETTTAFEIAKTYMATPIHGDRFTYMDMYQDVGNRLSIISILAKTKYRSEVLAWIEEYSLVEQWDKQIRGILAKTIDRNEGLIRLVPFQALLTYAKADPERVLPKLQRMFEEDKKMRMNAALCLYALGDNRGIAYVDAFRERREMLLPGEFDCSYEIIVRLANPALDALVLERVQHGNGEDLIKLWYKSALLKRLGVPLMRILLNYLDNPNPMVRQRSIYSCNNILRIESWGYSYQPRALYDATLEIYKEAVQQHIVALEK